MKQLVLKVHPKDNVLVALQNLTNGQSVAFNGEKYTLPEAVPAKHKFFMYDMNAGDAVIMYGVLVGKSTNAYTKRKKDDDRKLQACSRTLCLSGLPHLNGMRLTFQNSKNGRFMDIIVVTDG